MNLVQDKNVSDPVASLTATATSLGAAVSGELQPELAAVLAALSDPIRLAIVARLAEAGEGAEMACKAFDLPVVKSTCTHHFRVLREAGVVRQRVVGTTRLNSLCRDELETRFPGLLGAILSAVPNSTRS